MQITTVSHGFHLGLRRRPPLKLSLTPTLFVCTAMDSLIAIGVGLGMRAIVDTVAHETYRAHVIVGIWEGVVLNHFLAKYPTSMDPYVAFVFRLVVDYFYTQSMSRMVIIVLWSGLGMLLSDVAVEVSADRRFRRLWRRILSPRSRSSRVRFGSVSTAGSRTTTAHMPPPPSPVLRPTTHPVPGQFDQYSTVTEQTVSISEQTATAESPALSDHSSRLILSPTNQPLPRSPSELSYIDPLPSISDSHDHIDIDPRRQTVPPNTGVRYNADDIDAPSIHSGLTTPVNDPVSLSRPLDDDDRPRVHSGLTTPESMKALAMTHTPGLPPIRVYDVGDQPLAELPNEPPVPIRLTLADQSPSGPPVSFPEPSTSGLMMPPDYNIPNIPTPRDEVPGGTSRSPPPSFAEAMQTGVPDDDLESHIDESVISGDAKAPIVAKADDLRKQATERDKEVHRISEEIKVARRQRLPFDVLRLEVELEDAKTSAAGLHAKAARRYYRGRSRLGA